MVAELIARFIENKIIVFKTIIPRSLISGTTFI
jgi:hypothetical protein